MDPVVVVVRLSLDVHRECVFVSGGYWVECVHEVSILIGGKRDLDLIQVGDRKLDLC